MTNAALVLFIVSLALYVWKLKRRVDRQQEKIDQLYSSVRTLARKQSEYGASWGFTWDTPARPFREYIDEKLSS